MLARQTVAAMGGGTLVAVGKHNPQSCRPTSLRTHYKTRRFVFEQGSKVKTEGWREQDRDGLSRRAWGNFAAAEGELKDWRYIYLFTYLFSMSEELM